MLYDIDIWKVTQFVYGRGNFGISAAGWTLYSQDLMSICVLLCLLVNKISISVVLSRNVPWDILLDTRLSLLQIPICLGS